MASFLRHEPCPSCGSRDNLARYSDGSATCFSCKHYEPGDGEISDEKTATTVSNDWTQIRGEYQALKSRGISKETCEFAKYQVGEFMGKTCHIANHYEGGALVLQKLRLPDKKFIAQGPASKNAPLYLSWLWQKGKHLVITEGELDALSMLEAFERRWPVMSLPNGTGSVKQALTRDYEKLLQFDRIVLMFDEDEAGRKAVAEACDLLPPGRVSIAHLPEKDPNDTLLKHGPAALIRAFWDAPVWRPDGIVSGEEFTLESIKTPAVRGFELPFPKLQEMTLGLRKGEITLLTAGSGIGKSTLARELAYHLHQVHGLKVGNVFLEENNVKTAQGYVAIHNSVPLGRLRHNPDMITVEQWQDALTNVIQKRMWFYDHFGSLESKNLQAKLRYFAAVLQVDFIVLDHISIVVSGVESSKEGERKDIDMLMTFFASLTQSTGVGIVPIVHLKRVTGKDFNEGAQVALSDLRGSGALEQLSDNVWALERDQQGDKQTQMQLRILKGREVGETGEADLLDYNRHTGRIEVLGEGSAFTEI